MVMEALAVDVGAAGRRAKKRIKGKLLIWFSRLTWD
jgi:hypothetical protein